MENNPFVLGPDLWEEWGKQASITRKLGKAKADARHELNQARASLKVTAARLRLHIISNPTTYHLNAKRITEIMVDSALELVREYQDAVKRVHDAEYVDDIMNVDVNAGVDRRKTLENQVQLVSIEYHSEKNPKPLSKAAHQTISDHRRKAIRSIRDPKTSTSEE